MNRNNNDYKFNKKFVKKYVPIIFTINCIYIWVMIVIGTIKLFGNGILSMFIGGISIILNVYVHILAYMNLKDKYNIDDQN